MPPYDDDNGNSTLKDFALESPVIADDDVFDPDDSIPESMPERNDELDRIHRALAPVARGSSAKNRLIFGKPGQGKTAAVRLKRLQMEEQLSDVDGIDVTFVYVSCKENPSSYGVAQTIVQKLRGLDSKPKGHQLSELYDKIYRTMADQGGAFILILDEVDAIRAHKSKYDEPNEPNILYKFPRSRSSKSIGIDDAQIGVFGISNDRKFRKNLTPRCMDALGETTINFKPYNEEQLFQILVRRAARGLKNTTLTITDDGEYDFESDVVSKNQLRRCAEMAAQERGSARQALRYLGGAASIADGKGADRIKDEHIHQSEREVRQEFVHEILTDHTEDDLLAFTGVLWCEAVGASPAKTNQIHNHYSSVCSALDERTKVQRRMTERLKDLDLTGVVNMRKEIGGQPGGEYYVIDLALPFEDTLDVMQHEEPFTDKFASVIQEIRDNANINGRL